MYDCIFQGCDRKFTRLCGVKQHVLRDHYEEPPAPAPALLHHPPPPAAAARAPSVPAAGSSQSHRPSSSPPPASVLVPLSSSASYDDVLHADGHSPRSPGSAADIYRKRDGGMKRGPYQRKKHRMVSGAGSKDHKKDPKNSLSLARFLQQSCIDKDLLPICEQVITNLNGTQHVDSHNREINFHGSVVGQRTGPGGAFVLVRWDPEGILEDEWIPKEEVKQEEKALTRTVSMKSFSPEVLNELVFQRKRRPRAVPMKQLFGSLQPDQLFSTDSPMETESASNPPQVASADSFPSFEDLSRKKMKPVVPGVQAAKDMLLALKKAQGAGEFPKDLHKRVKTILFSTEAHPLQGKVLEILQRCVRDGDIANCGVSLQNAINEERFSFCQDVIDILIADKSSETFRHSHQPPDEERPADLETIKKKLEKRAYPSPLQFTRDIQQLLNKQLEKNPSTQLVTLKTKFEGLLEYIH